jgi:2-hydroxychromene-2-carboxylate isomerase
MDKIVGFSFDVGSDMFFGRDRLDHVRDALARA